MLSNVEGLAPPHEGFDSVENETPPLGSHGNLFNIDVLALIMGDKNICSRLKCL